MADISILQLPPATSLSVNDVTVVVQGNVTKKAAIALFQTLGVYTVATLPSATTSGLGARAFVTNALSPTFGATVVAGGAVVTPVYSDGTNWKVG
jgi:hypothetical protein